MAKEEKKKKNKKAKNKESFFKSLKNEVSKVKWPSGKELIKYTIATIVLCVVLILFFQLLEIILAYIKELFN